VIAEDVQSYDTETLYNAYDYFRAGVDAYTYSVDVSVTGADGMVGNEMSGMNLFTEYVAPDQRIRTELIAPASNLSAMPLVNYTTFTAANRIHWIWKRCSLLRPI